MSRTLSPKLAGYAGLAALGLLGALALRLPELVVLAAPFALLPALSMLASPAPKVDVSVEIERDRALEDDELEALVTLQADTGAERLELLLGLPRNVAVGSGDNPAAIYLAGGEHRELRLSLRCERWGAYRVGLVFLRARDPFGFTTWEWTADCRRPLKVYPREEALRTLLRPLQTQVFSGNHVARQKGEGIEFADLRPFVPGDRIRRVNWRASARRGELWVNEQHAERNADVVIFLDTFTEAERGGRSTLDLALRAAASLVARYLREKDRVGFVTFGGMLNWLLPATGTAQLYRIVDSLLDTQIVLSYAWRDLDVIPLRVLPPQALVFALTPLLDERAVAALLDLRARGFDLVVVEISPLPFVPAPAGQLERVGQQLWRLRREEIRGRFAAAGVPVTVWDDERSLAAGLEEVTTFRRHAWVARA